jgi:hypothetical protein
MIPAHKLPAVQSVTRHTPSQITRLLYHRCYIHTTGLMLTNVKTIHVPFYLFLLQEETLSTIQFLTIQLLTLF